MRIEQRSSVTAPFGYEMPINTPKQSQRKHKQIFDEVLQAIHSGQYKPGQQLPSEAKFVQQYSVSRPTVARALRDLEYKGLVDRRAGSGTYVCAPEQPGTSVFGLLIPELGETEIFEPICKGMAAAAQGISPYALLWGNSTSTPETRESEAEKLCQYYIDQHVSGVFFSPLELTSAKDAVNRRITDALEHEGIPIVLLDRDLEKYPQRSRHDLVGIDNRRAGYILTEHLLKLGCKRITFVGRSHSAATVDARISGYREALTAFDIVIDSNLVQLIDPADRSQVQRMLNDLRPDGFVCANDFTAAHLMDTLDGLGVRIPGDVRLVGIDDVKYASLLRVPLTTIHQPCAELGAASISAMLERIAHPEMPAREILLDFKLIVRGSCGA
jgi:DNA-binding LacI/PurR family transcriptional regulator